MTVLRVFICCIVCFCTTPAFSETFDSDLFILDVPAGFQGPMSGSMDAEGSVVAFVKPHPNASTNTLLQITIITAPPGAQAIPADKLGPLSEHYLDQFLRGIERRRTNFSSTKPVRVSLGGLPASKTTWVGVALGRQMRGTMYCVIVGTRIFSLHAQDFGSAPRSYLREAEAALKTIRFKNGG